MCGGTAEQTRLFIHPASYTLYYHQCGPQHAYTPSISRPQIKLMYTVITQGLHGDRSDGPRGRRINLSVNLRDVDNMTLPHGVFFSNSAFARGLHTASTTVLVVVTPLVLILNEFLAFF